MSGPPVVEREPVASAPLILAVDTTGNDGSIALVRGTDIRVEWPVHAPTGFSHVLFEHIRNLLEDYGVTPAQIDLFAAAAGPGSFTGVRVGLAAMKGLAEVLGKRAAGVSNLAALAEYGTTNARAAVIDARRGEIYGALYDAEGRQRIPETVARMERFRELLPDEPIEWITQSALLIPRDELRVVRAPNEIASAVARIAGREGGRPPEAVEANYVRRSDAELFWKGR